MKAVDERLPLVVETDASDHGIAAVLNLSGRPLAFFSRTLSPSASLGCREGDLCYSRSAYEMAALFNRVFTLILC